jgi:hypothetical protein
MDYEQDRIVGCIPLTDDHLDGESKNIILRENKSMYSRVNRRRSLFLPWSEMMALESPKSRSSDNGAGLG